VQLARRAGARARRAARARKVRDLGHKRKLEPVLAGERASALGGASCVAATGCPQDTTGLACARAVAALLAKVARRAVGVRGATDDHAARMDGASVKHQAAGIRDPSTSAWHRSARRGRTGSYMCRTKTDTTHERTCMRITTHTRVHSTKPESEPRHMVQQQRCLPACPPARLPAGITARPRRWRGKRDIRARHTNTASGLTLERHGGDGSVHGCSQRCDDAEQAHFAGRLLFWNRFQDRPRAGRSGKEKTQRLLSFLGVTQKSVRKFERSDLLYLCTIACCSFNKYTQDVMQFMSATHAQRSNLAGELGDSLQTKRGTGRDESKVAIPVHGTHSHTRRRARTKKERQRSNKQPQYTHATRRNAP
jgi:hypothetical protein